MSIESAWSVRLVSLGPYSVDREERRRCALSGDITALTEGADSEIFTYDGLGRLTSAYGRTYTYDAANRLTAFNGNNYNYGDAGPYHAVDRIGSNDRFDYDANGNMTVRNKGVAGRQQTFVWDPQNRLSQVQDDNGDLVEQYWYDVDGARVKKLSGNTTTYTFFGHYEEEVTNGVTTVISHYAFGGLRVALKRGSALYHVHGDHLGSASVTTAGSVVEGSRAYFAYGAERSASGSLHTDRTFTGQKENRTGLLYYNARYYDRFLYAHGNPTTFLYHGPERAVLKGSRDNPSKLLGNSNRAFSADRSTSLQTVVSQAKCH